MPKALCFGYTKSNSDAPSTNGAVMICTVFFHHTAIIPHVLLVCLQPSSHDAWYHVKIGTPVISYHIPPTSIVGATPPKAIKHYRALFTQ